MKHILILIPLFLLSFYSFAQEVEAEVYLEKTIEEKPEEMVPEDAKEICPILIGEKVPESELKNIKNESVQITEEIKDRGTVLIFYRGGWCPYCNKQLSGLSEVEEEIKEEGFQIIAVSPDNAEHLQKTVDKEELNYTLLSDAKMELARKMGIAFKMDKKTLKKYKLFGINLEKASGESHFQLPAPAVFILDKEGVIRMSYVNPNYKVRLNANVLLTVIKSMH